MCPVARTYCQRAWHLGVKSHLGALRDATSRAPRTTSCSGTLTTRTATSTDDIGEAGYLTAKSAGPTIRPVNAPHHVWHARAENALGPQQATASSRKTTSAIRQGHVPPRTTSYLAGLRFSLYRACVPSACVPQRTRPCGQFDKRRVLFLLLLSRGLLEREKKKGNAQNARKKICEVTQNLLTGFK